MLVGFAGSVVGTRVYLDLTGYPTVGGDTLHIAHAVWGGLLLLVGAVLPLALVNRAVLPWAALATGVGGGLFVDEVGKFITVDNDYFFAAAAPIAYAVFVVALLLYLRVRRRRDPAPRSQLLAGLELVAGAVDRGLPAHDRRRLEERLSAAARSSEPHLARTAGTLLDLVRSGGLDADEDDGVRPGRVWRRLRRVGETVGAWLSGRRLRVLTVLVVGVLALAALADLALVALVAVDLRDGTVDVVDAVDEYVRVDVLDALGVTLVLARVALDAVVGVLLAAAAVLLIRGREDRGRDLAGLALLIALTTADVLFFYSEQFLAAGVVLVHLLALALVRHRPAPTESRPASAAAEGGRELPERGHRQQVPAGPGSLPGETG